MLAASYLWQIKNWNKIIVNTISSKKDQNLGHFISLSLDSTCLQGPYELTAKYCSLIVSLY